MRLDPRRIWIKRRRDDVIKQRGARADEHELAGEIGEIGVGLENFPGRDRAAGVGLGEPDAQFSVSLNRNHHVADLDRLDARALARRVSEGGRRFHHIARRALGDTQRLHRQTRLDLAVDGEQERHAADDAVVVRQPVEKAEAARGVRESGNRNERSLELVEEGHRRVADEGEARLRDEARLRAIVGRGEEDAEHDGTIGNRVRETHIAVGALLAMPGLVGAMDGALGAGLHVCRRPVLLGEQDVEPDRGDIGLDQRLDEIRHGLARPRPSADEVNRLVVDVDDADRLIEIVGPRPPALVLIENEVFQIAPKRGEQRPKGQRQDIGADDDQPVGPPLPRSAQSLFRPKFHRIGDPSNETKFAPAMDCTIVAERSARSTKRLLDLEFVEPRAPY